MATLPVKSPRRILGSPKPSASKGLLAMTSLALPSPSAQAPHDQPSDPLASEARCFGKTTSNLTFNFPNMGRLSALFTHGSSARSISVALSLIHISEPTRLG